jgi:hypothetical protein
MKPLIDDDGIELKLGDKVNVLYDIAPSPGNDWQGDIAGETGILKHDGENYFIEWQQKKFREEGYYTATFIINDNCAVYQVKEAAHVS